MPNSPGTGFIHGSLALPASKVDDHALITPLVSTMTSADWNLVRQYLSDVRDAIKSGDILGLQNVPTAALSPAATAYLRLAGTQLQASINGAAYKSLNKEAKTINVLDFGADPTGVLDSTTAFQNALNAFNGNSSTGVGASSGTIFIPNGLYLISSTLNYYGNVSQHLNLIGEHANKGGSGAVELRWTGAVNTPMFHLFALNSSRIEHITFNGNFRAQYCVWIDTLQPTGGSGSDNIIFTKCYFLQPYNGAAGSACLALSRVSGTTYQVDNMDFFGCYFQGDRTQPFPGIGILTLQGGNTKNFRFFGGLIQGFATGIDFSNCGPGNGTCFIGVAGGDCTDTWIKAGSGIASLIACEVEQAATAGAKFFSGGTSTGVGQLNVLGCYYSFLGTTGGGPATDDLAATFTGSLMMHGNFFANLRATSSLAKVQCNNTAGAVGGLFNGTVMSLNNVYSMAVDHAPLFDSNGNELCAGDYAQSVNLDVLSWGDKGTNISGLAIKLRPVLGLMPSMQQGRFTQALSGTGITYSRQGELHRFYQEMTITFAALTAAGLTQVLNLGIIPAGALVTRVKAKVTTPFKGGTITALTISADNDNVQVGAYLTAFDAWTAAITRGNVDSDLGTLVNRANSVWGGGVAAEAIRFFSATFTAVGGNLNTLTQGSVTFRIEYLQD